MLNIGIVGLGRLGTSHANNLAAMPEARLTSVFDPKPEAAELGRDKYGMTAVASVQELVASPEVDAVCVASPTYCHAEAVLLALQAGKPVFCEKPICRTMAEAEQLLQAEASSKSRVAVGFVRRFHPSQHKLQQLLQDGLLGKLRFCNVDLVVGAFKRQPGDWFADFQLSGGVILDMLAHHLDLLNWGFGAPDHVYCEGLLMDPALPEPNDYASATLVYKNGVICNLLCGWQRFGRSANCYEIYGDNGSLTCTWGAKHLVYYPKNGEKQELAYEATDESPYATEIKSWVARIAAGAPPEVTLQDGVNSLRIALAMITSSQEKRVVKL
ncbi:MAG: Gfo/Idh/MocA family oxidoreductase [Lentisphaeria bacterium]|nr:Gfo/Idh/MocA family oxidoreductase [Lentisphaeria bacterium]